MTDLATQENTRESMSQKGALVRRKVERRGRGAPVNHTNSVVNGVWSNLRRRGLDGRSKLAKAMDAAEADLVTALGTPWRDISADNPNSQKQNPQTDSFLLTEPFITS